MPGNKGKDKGIWRKFKGGNHGATSAPEFSAAVLGGHEYDMEFREWAAAKGTKVWGELNLAIYGHCLAALPTPSPKYPPKQESKRTMGKKQSTILRLHVAAPSPNVILTMYAGTVEQ